MHSVIPHGGRLKRAAPAGVPRRRPDGLFPVPRGGTRVAIGACDEHNAKAHRRLS